MGSTQQNSKMEIARDLTASCNHPLYHCHFSSERSILILNGGVNPRKTQSLAFSQTTHTNLLYFPSSAS